MTSAHVRKPPLLHDTWQVVVTVKLYKHLHDSAPQTVSEQVFPVNDYEHGQRVASAING